MGRKHVSKNSKAGLHASSAQPIGQLGELHRAGIQLPVDWQHRMSPPSRSSEEQFAHRTKALSDIRQSKWFKLLSAVQQMDGRNTNVLSQHPDPADTTITKRVFDKATFDWKYDAGDVVDITVRSWLTRPGERCGKFEIQAAGAVSFKLNKENFQGKDEPAFLEAPHFAELYGATVMTAGEAAQIQLC